MRRNILNILKLQMLMLMTFSSFGQGVFSKPPVSVDIMEELCWSSTSGPEISFKIPVYFVNIEFETIYDPINGITYSEVILPCDVFIGVTLGDFSPIFSSAIDDVVYYSSLDFYGDEYFKGFISFTISEDLILEYFTKYPCVHNLVELPIKAGVYCQKNGLMNPVDYCEDYDLWASIIYNNPAPDPDNCLMELERCIKTVCDFPPTTAGDAKGLDYLNNQEVKILSFESHVVISINRDRSNKETKENISYTIYDLRGNVLKNKNLGFVGDGNFMVEYDDLPAGMYMFTTNINGVIQSKKIVKF